MIHRPALITYITAGDPDLNATLNFMLTLDKYADVIELGIPFSDPVMDGKTIQKANIRALESGTGVQNVLGIVEEFRKFSDTPVVLMSYYNPIYVRGIEKFVRDAKEAGVDGMVIADLPVEEAKAYLDVCGMYEMATIFFAAPNTPMERLKTIDEISSAFVYLVSAYGTTGIRQDVSKLAFYLIRRARKICKKPLAVGFGISKPEHVSELIKAGADGIVVGSALVEIIERYAKNATVKIENKLRELKLAMK